MAKTKRVMQECLSEVDLVLELLDARIPYSSKNPEIERLLSTKPKITVLTKFSLADETASAKWVEYYKKSGRVALMIDSQTGYGIDNLENTVRQVMKEKLDRYQAKGMTGRKIKAMIVGIPNVGKSSLINRLAGGKRAKVENRPGVTLAKQWVPTSIGLDLLDMPGVLWPKFEDDEVGQNLALTGAIRDQILDTEELAMILCGRLMKICPDKFCERYKLNRSDAEELDAYDLFVAVGKQRGFLISGGEINEERTANMLLEEFRSAKIGRITLETPKD
jgi:ribosome biogenesis GTPase A